MSVKKILIYGYGNPGRQDDGLGNAMIEKLTAWAVENNINNWEFDSNYQLNIEDAAEIADKDLVVFVDASTEEIENFILTPVTSETKVAFTSHAASPGYIVQLSKEIYGRIPATYLLHIKGYEWAFKEGLSEKAIENLNAAFQFISQKLQSPEQMIYEFQEVQK